MKNLNVNRWLVTVMLTLLHAAFSYGQLSRSTVGLKGGMNISHLSVSGLNDESNRIGYHFGAFARLGITEGFAIQPEALFAVKGAELNFNNAFVTGGAILSLKYVDFPVLAVFNLTRHFNFHVGPYASYLIGASVKNESTNEGSDFESEISRDNFKKMDFGIVAGAGMELRSLSFGVRYLQGLTNVGESRTFFGEQYNFPDGKNMAWQLYVGLSLF